MEADGLPCSLTDELAQGWIYAPAVRLLDDG